MSLGECRGVFMPYCLERQADGCYAVVNRRYKPLGFNTLDWIHYEHYPILGRLPGLTARVAVKLSARGSDSLERIFLYNDTCLPTQSKAAMDAYLERLRVFMALKVRPCAAPHLHAADPARPADPARSRNP